MPYLHIVTVNNKMELVEIEGGRLPLYEKGDKLAYRPRGEGAWVQAEVTAYSPRSKSLSVTTIGGSG